MKNRTVTFLGSLALALPALAQQAAVPPATAADPHAGHGTMMAAPASAQAGGQPSTSAATGTTSAAPTTPVAASTTPAAASSVAGGAMPHETLHGPGGVGRDGSPGGHEAHGAAGAGGMAHGGGMGGCKMMGGRGAMMGGGQGGRDASDEAFHRDLMARIDRVENRLILMETLLRERLKTP